jgi:hypothetical protein
MLSLFKVKSCDNIHRNIMTNIIGTKINKTPIQTPEQILTQTEREKNNQKRILELERLEKEGIEPDLNLKREMNNSELERVLKEINN